MASQHKFETISSIIELTFGISSEKMTWLTLFKKIINKNPSEIAPHDEILKSYIVKQIQGITKLTENITKQAQDIFSENMMNQNVSEKIQYDPITMADIIKPKDKIIEQILDVTEYDYGQILFSVAIIDGKKYFIRGFVINDYLFFDYDDECDYESYTDKIYNLCWKQFKELDNAICASCNIDLNEEFKILYTDVDINFFSRFMISHGIYLLKTYGKNLIQKLPCNLFIDKSFGQAMCSKYIDFKPRFVSNNFTLKKNELVINDFMDIQHSMVDPTFKNKFFGGDDEMSFNDFIIFIITTFVPESVYLDCLKNQIHNISLTDISRDHEIVNIYFYEGFFNNDKLLELHANKQLVYTSNISVSKRLLLKYSKTYDTFITKDKFLNEVWFINTACNQYVADCVLDTIKSGGIWKNDNKFIDGFKANELVHYLQILNFMGVRTFK